MEYGGKYGSDRAYYWKQTNNSTEAIIRATKAETIEMLVASGFNRATVTDLLKGYLESCGGGEVTNCCAALLGPKTPDPQRLFGWTRPLVSLDDIVMACFNNPDNVDLMRAAIPGFDGTYTMENRYMPLHAVVAGLLFGIKAEHRKVATYEDVRDQLKLGNTVGVHLPKHYTAAVRYVEDGDFFKINDSWGGRKPEWKGDGFNQVLERTEFATAHKEIVVYFNP
jgi:hypothetical protein